MGRILWVLPLCLILQDHLLQDQRNFHESVVPDGNSEKINPIVCEVVASLAVFPSAPFPASVPWPWYQIGKKDVTSQEKLLFEQPTKFLQACLDKYDREVKGYRVLFCKREMVNGKLRNHEKILVHFQQEPFSVHFEFKEGAGKAIKVLYVDKQNLDSQGRSQMKVRPYKKSKDTWARFGSFRIWPKYPDDDEARETSRYTIKEFGIRAGMKDTLRSMLAAEAKGKLFVKYEGQVPVPKLGGKICHKFVRTPYDPPENEHEKLNKLILYYDVDSWLQVGSELWGLSADGKGERFIAEYYFRDLVLNPTHDEHQFTDKTLNHP